MGVMWRGRERPGGGGLL